MRPFIWAVLIASSLAVLPAATAQQNALTREQVIALANERAPRILVARARIEEVRGRLIGASAWFNDNPTVDASAGQRESPDGEFLEMDLGVRQSLELFGTRAARIDDAEAGVARAEARNQEAARLVLRDAVTAFLGALKAREQVRINGEAEAVSAEMVRIADRRYKAGDVAILDVNAARASQARSRSEVRDAEAAHHASIGVLRRLLGLGSNESADVEGTLRDELRQYDQPRLLAGIAERPDLRARISAIDQAQAEVKLGSALRWPGVGVGAQYKREERADVVMGNVSLSLPLFQRGQGVRAEAAARARRLRIELEEARKAVDNEVRTDLQVYRSRLESVAELQEHAVPLLEANESLTRRSYEAGERPLTDWIVARREALDTKREHLNRLLEAATAAVELETAAGILR